MNIEQTKELLAKIEAGVKAGVADALEEHRRMGRKVAVWRDGGVALVTVEEALSVADHDDAPPS